MIRTRHLYDARAVTRPPLHTSAPIGLRSTNIVRDGSVTGERIRGRIVPAGGDWMLVDAAGTGHGDALQRLRAGRAIEESDTYFRVAPTFTAPAAYGWLNNVQAIGVGRLEPDDDGGAVVHYRVFEVL